jgi:ATP-dependent RNA helicase RhlE
MRPMQENQVLSNENSVQPVQQGQLDFAASDSLTPGLPTSLSQGERGNVEETSTTAVAAQEPATPPAQIRFVDLGLAEPIIRAVLEKGYEVPTPIQAKAIPIVMQGLDVMGGAQTGTGKTAAFTLPILHRILPKASSSPSPARHPVRALILSPTRELAIQIEENVEAYSKYTGLRSTVVFGGVDIKEQKAIVRAGVEVLIATPGRLLDHLEQKNLSLNQVEVLVLDEADRMLDMGFIPDIKRILALLPKERQSLLFSATFNNEIKKLADEMLKKPVLIEVAKRNTAAETVDQSCYKVREDDKRKLLAHLVRSQNLTQVLVFCRRKMDVGRLASALSRDGFATGAIHGDKTQDARMEALEDFKAGKITILVATDVAARGIDISDLPVVVNYELPYVSEDYVHRIGRTGRAGASGRAISLVSPEDEKLLADIEKLLKKPVRRENLPDLSEAGGTTRAPRETRSGTREAREPRAPRASADDRFERELQNARRKRDETTFDNNPDQIIVRSPGVFAKRAKEVPALLKPKVVMAAEES